jgi:type IV pilus assembly protein PilW
MVGLAIAMIATVAMFGTFGVSERMKRTTTGAADAQSNGAIAMYLLERDAKMAGWGLQVSEFANCDTFYTWHDSKGGAIDDNATAGSSILASVVIADGGTGPDAVTIQYYDDPASQTFDFGVTSIRSSMPQPSSVFKVASVQSCAEGELVLVSQGDHCTLAQISSKNTSSLDLYHAKGVNWPYNPDTPDMVGWPTYTAGAKLQCFQQLYRRTYQVAGTQLELVQPDSAGVMQTFPVAPEILDLQAQYGIADAGGGQQVNQWVNATGVFSKPTITNIKRIKAIRVAMLARSATYEKPDAAGNCNATTDTAATGWSSWATFTTSRLPTDWKCYRYKPFEITIPLRNIIWAKT